MKPDTLLSRVGLAASLDEVGDMAGWDLIFGPEDGRPRIVSPIPTQPKTYSHRRKYCCHV
jgi:hypothetical protein